MNIPKVLNFVLQRTSKNMKSQTTDGMNFFFAEHILIRDLYANYRKNYYNLRRKTKILTKTEKEYKQSFANKRCRAECNDIHL